MPSAKTELPWRNRVEVFATDPSNRIFGGVWDNDKSFAVPGGGIDADESPLAAAMREYMEETGMSIADPELVPIGPIDHPWSPELQRKKNFAGSRTHFVRAKIDPTQTPAESLDYWGANQRGWYDPSKAIELMQNKQYQAPVVAAARLAVLQQLLAMAKSQPLVNLGQQAANAAAK